MIRKLFAVAAFTLLPLAALADTAPVCRSLDTVNATIDASVVEEGSVKIVVTDRARELANAISDLFGAEHYKVTTIIAEVAADGETVYAAGLSDTGCVAVDGVMMLTTWNKARAAVGLDPTPPPSAKQGRLTAPRR